MILLIVIEKIETIRYIASGTTYEGDTAHNVKALTAYIDCMKPEDVIFILSPQYFIYYLNAYIHKY
jgi:hypothetical protein